MTDPIKTAPALPRQWDSIHLTAGKKLAAGIAVTIGLPLILVSIAAYHLGKGVLALAQRATGQVSPHTPKSQEATLIDRLQAKSGDGCKFNSEIAGSVKTYKPAQLQAFRKTLDKHFEPISNPGKGNCGFYAISQFLTISAGLNRVPTLTDSMKTEMQAALTTLGAGVEQHESTNDGALIKKFAALGLHDQSYVLRQMVGKRLVEDGSDSAFKPIEIFEILGAGPDLQTKNYEGYSTIEAYAGAVRTKNGLRASESSPVMGAGALYADAQLELAAMSDIFQLNLLLDNRDPSGPVVPELLQDRSDVCVRRSVKWNGEPHFELMMPREGSEPPPAQQM